MFFRQFSKINLLSLKISCNLTRMSFCSTSVISDAVSLFNNSIKMQSQDINRIHAIPEAQNPLLFLFGRTGLVFKQGDISVIDKLVHQLVLNTLLILPQLGLSDLQQPEKRQHFGYTWSIKL